MNDLQMCLIIGRFLSIKWSVKRKDIMILENLRLDIESFLKRLNREGFPLELALKGGLVNEDVENSNWGALNDWKFLCNS